jgi:predicted porin
MAFVRLTYAALLALTTVNGQWGQINYSDSTNGSKASIYMLRATCVLSKRTAAYATSERMLNKGSANFSVSGGAYCQRMPMWRCQRRLAWAPGVPRPASWSVCVTLTR